MPFFRRQNIMNDCLLGIWQVDEPLSYFQKRVHLHPEEVDILKPLSERKKLEWYASRWTLHLLTGSEDRSACRYDAFGKPYLDGSELEISMSHSQSFVAVMVGHKPLGVDIQIIAPKIHRIKQKFLCENELEMIDEINPLEILHVYWGAKESLYKAYGRGQLAFSEDIKIDPFFYYENGGLTTGSVQKDDYFRTFEIEYSLIQNYMLVYAREADKK